MIDTLASLVVALVVIVGATLAQALEWLDKTDNHPGLKSVVEAKPLRVILLFVAIGLLGVVLRDVIHIRELLDADT